MVAKGGQVFSGITIYSFFVGSLIFQFLLVFVLREFNPTCGAAVFLMIISLTLKEFVIF